MNRCSVAAKHYSRKSLSFHSFRHFSALFISLRFPLSLSLSPSPFSFASHCLHWIYLRHRGTLDLFDIRYFTIHKKWQFKSVFAFERCAIIFPMILYYFFRVSPNDMATQNSMKRIRRGTNYCAKVEAKSENMCQVLVSWLKSNWFEFQRHITI